MHIAARLLVATVSLIGGQQAAVFGETIAPATEPGNRSEAQGLDVGDMDRTFAEIVNEGGQVSCARESRWSKLRGQSLYDDLAFLRAFSEVACLYSRYWPHRLGLMDVMGGLAPMLEDDVRIQQMEEALLGGDPGYYVTLRQSPLLLKHLEVLSRNSYLTMVIIEARSVDSRLLQAVQKLKVSRGLEVGYSDGKCRILYVLGSSFPNSGADELAKAARVELDDAEAAIPSLKAIPHLESVELTKQGGPISGWANLDDKENTRAARVQKTMRESLPNVEIR